MTTVAIGQRLVVQISCDESGSEGENLVGGSARVFAHGSTDLDAEAAAAFIDDLRRATGYEGDEVKATALLRSTARRRTLLHLFENLLRDHARINLVDKAYMAVAKVIDLVIEEDAYARGVDLYSDMKARDMALKLFRDGPRAFGAERWHRLVNEFVSYVRRTQRVGTKTTERELLQTIDDLRLRNTRRGVTEIMQLLWQGRDYLAQYGPDQRRADSARTLDPLIPAIVSTARVWHEQYRLPIEIIHDKQAALDERAVSQIIDGAKYPWPWVAAKVPIVAIKQADSRHDARVQVADLVAGVGAWLAAQALQGTLADSVVAPFRSLVVGESLWADAESWELLSGRGAY